MDIIDRLEQIIGKSRRSGMNAYFCCPFCDDDRYRFGVHIHKHIAACFNCGTSGRIPMMLLNAPKLQNKHLIYAVTEHEGPAEFKQDAPIVCPEPECAYPLQIRRTLASIPFWEYLDRRNMDAEWILSNRVQFAITGKLANRVIFPIYDDHDQLTFWVARSIIPDIKPKTLYPSGIQRPLWCYRHFSQDELICIGEGIFDAYALHGVALLGSKISDNQTNQLIALHAKEYIICLDADKAGKEGTVELASILSSLKFKHRWINITIVKLPNGKDPHDMLSKIDEFLAQRQPFNWSTYVDNLFP